MRSYASLEQSANIQVDKESCLNLLNLTLEVTNILLEQFPEFNHADGALTQQVSTRTVLVRIPLPCR